MSRASEPEEMAVRVAFRVPPFNVYESECVGKSVIESAEICFVAHSMRDECVCECLPRGSPQRRPPSDTRPLAGFPLPVVDRHHLLESQSS